VSQRGNANLAWTTRNRVGSAITLLLLAILGYFALSPRRYGKHNQDLRRLLNEHGIGSVVVFGVPEDRSNSRALAPEELEREPANRGPQSAPDLRVSGWKKIELHPASAPDESLNLALSTTTCVGEANSVDARTAIVFYDRDHKRLRSFYYGPAAQSGQIDQKPCQLSPDLYRWAKKVLGR
jgi:hypothetical protein